MKRILVPADFSAPGQAALSFAADLARRSGARLLVRDYAPLAEATPELVAASPIVSIVSDPGRVAFWVAAHEDLSIRVDRTEHTPVDDLTGSCQRELPDLVLLGATGTNHELGLIDENTARLARHIACPLLVIEKPARLPLRRILFVSDFSEPETSVFKRLQALMGIYGPEVHLLYVKNSQYFDMPLILAEAVMRDYADLAKPLTCHTHVAQGGSVSETVSEYIARLDVDLVALGNQPRSLFYRLLTEDVLSRVLRDNDVPVLILPR